MEERIKNKILDLVIIGIGPAGITAAIYAFRKNLDFLIVGSEKGGQVSKAFTIENYPGLSKISGLELTEKFFNHLKEFKIEPLIDEVVKIEKNEELFKVVLRSGEIFQARSILVASGRKPRTLGVPGEEEFLGKGVSYCVTCDGPLFKNKPVAVIGGGNSGFEAALYLKKICPEVFILERGEEVIADEENQKKAKEKNIEIILNAQVKEIKGKDLVEKLVYEDLKTKESKELEINGVFIEIGGLPAAAFLQNLVDYNQAGEIIVDLKTFQTKTPGLFAAGDVIDFPYKQIIIAAGQGASAALSVYNFLRNRI
jgi:thioredoxin-disulfide reductase